MIYLKSHLNQLFLSVTIFPEVLTCLNRSYSNEKYFFKLNFQIKNHKNLRKNLSTFLHVCARTHVCAGRSGGVRSFHFIPKCPSFNISNVLRDASVLQSLGDLQVGLRLLSRSVLQLVVIVRRWHVAAAPRWIERSGWNGIGTGM